MKKLPEIFAAGKVVNGLHIDYLIEADTAANEFDEDRHPRARDGKFTSAPERPALPPHPAQAHVVKSALDKVEQAHAEGNAVVLNVLGKHPVPEVAGYAKAKAGLWQPKREAEAATESSETKAGRTDTPEFRAWFAGSKVVDSEGKPLRVYHGTLEKFQQFDPSKARRGESGIVQFTDNPELASGYGDRVMPVFLSLKNPMPYSEWRKLPYGGEAKEAAAKGYDGMAHPEAGVYFAFKPEQIKSVFNRGTWSKDDPDIGNERPDARTCPGCGRRFDAAGMREAAMGAVACPDCGKRVAQAEALANSGTTIGTLKGWETRRRGDHTVKDEFVKENLSADSAVFATQGHVPDSLNGVPFAPVKDYDASKVPDVAVDEPPLPHLMPHEHMAAGVIVTEPDGRVWLYEPKNHWAGYQNTFSKGTQEEGMTLQQTALKELHEETGLTAKIKGYVGDWAGTQSVSRFYHGVRTGGSPVGHKGDETLAVKLVTPDDAGKILNTKRDQKILHALADKGIVERPATKPEFVPRPEPEYVGGKHWSETPEPAHKWSEPKVGTSGHAWQPQPKPVAPQPRKPMLWTDYLKQFGNEGGVRCGDGWISADKVCRVGEAGAGAPQVMEHYDSATSGNLGVSKAALEAAAKKEPEPPAPEAPAAPAAEPGTSPSQPIQVGADWKKLTGKLGTSEGGQYQAPDGKLYYVKWMDEGRVRNEVLAAELYKLAGSPVADYRYAKGPNGEWGTATAWKESGKTDWSSKASKDEAAKDFATHAWLANWDCIGAGSENPMDNQKIGPDGKMFTVDTGGALRYSGMGSLNPDKLKPTADEWTTLRDPYKNASAATVFKGMTQEQLKASAEKLQAATPGKIIDAVNKAYDGNPPPQLAATLIKRREDLLDKSGVGVWEAKAPQPAAEVQAAKAAKVGVSGAQWAAKEQPAKPVLSSPANPNVSYVAKATQIEQHMQSGNKAGILAVETNPNAKQSYAQNLHAYKVAAYKHLGGDPSDIPQPKGAVGVSGATWTPKPVTPTPAPAPEPQKPFAPVGAAPVKPVLSTAANPNLGYVNKASQIEAAVNAGDKGALEAVQTNPHAQQTYAKKLHEYHLAAYKHLGGDPQQLAASLAAKAAAKTSKETAKAMTSATATPPAAKPKPAPTLETISFTESDLPPKPPKDKWGTHSAENWKAIEEIDKLALAKDLPALKAYHSPSGWVMNSYKGLIIGTIEDKLHPPKEVTHEGFPAIAAQIEIPQTMESFPHAGSTDYVRMGSPGVNQELDFKPHSMKQYLLHNDSKELAKHQKAWDAAPDAVQKTWTNYTGSHYIDWNNSLRAGKAPSQAVLNAARKIVTDAPELPVGVRLQRHVSLSAQQQADLKKETGRILADPAFSSTGTYGSGKNTHFHFLTGPGVKAQCMVNNSVEKEVLLAPNQPFYVVGWSESGGKLHVHCRLLPTQDGQCCKQFPLV